MRQLFKRFIEVVKLMRYPRVFAGIILQHLKANFGLLFFMIELNIRYHGIINNKLLRKFKWKHILKLKRWISGDKYLALCKNIFECNLSRLKSEEVVRICFVVCEDARWSCGELYSLLNNDKRFQACVLLAVAADSNQRYDRIKGFYENRGYRTYEAKEWGGVEQ